MENASKALIMAGGILITIIVIGAFILAMREVSDFQNTRHGAELEQQTLEFNNLYESYNHNRIRGNEIISLMNRIVDYNNRKTAEGYKKMQVEFTIPQSIRSRLTFDGTNRLLTKASNTYTEDDIDDIVGLPTSITGDISGGAIRDLEDKYGQAYCNQLSSEISNISDINNLSGRTTAQKNTEFDNRYRFPKSASSYGGISQILEDAKLYYEYVQFKRTYFNCTGTEYDDDTGRIIKMEFECTGIGV